MVIILIGASWLFLQSRSFARLLSKAITEVSSKQFNSKVKFTSVSIRFFPPGMALEGVKFIYSKDGTTIESQAGELGASINYNFFSGKKIRIHEIFLREAWLKLEIPKSGKNQLHPWDQIQDEITKLPVAIDSILIEQSRVEAMGVEVDISLLETTLGENEINLTGEVKDLSFDGIDKHLDLINTEAILTRDSLRFKKVRVLEKRSKLEGSGEFQNWASKNDISISGTFNTDVFIADIKDFVNLEPVNLTGGVLVSNGEMSWSKSLGPKLTMDFILSDFESSVGKAKRVSGKIRSEKTNVIAEQLKLENGSESVELLKSATIWNQDAKKLFPDGLELKLDKLDLQNALTILRDSLEPLRGYVSGNLDFYLKGKDLKFVAHDGAKIEQLGLRTKKEDGSSFDIVRAPIVWLNNTVLRVDEGVFSMKGMIKAPQTQVEVDGRVGKGEAYFNIGPGPINLEDFGNLAELELKGSGVNTIKVRGPLDNVTLQVDGEFKDFQILDYRLGNTTHQFIIDLGKGAVNIPVFSSKKARYQYGGTGVVQWKNFLMDISIQLPQISFTEFKDAIYPLRDGLSFLPPDFEGTMQGNVEMMAKNNIQNLIVAADVYAQKLVAYGEAFRDAKFAFMFKDKMIKLDGFSITKETGKATGEISYSIPESRVDYKLSLRGLSSSEISYYKRLPLALDFKAAGEFQGWRTEKKWRHRGFTGLSGTKVLDRDLPDSTFEWDFKHDSVLLDARFARDWINLNAQSLPSSQGARIDAKLEVDIPELPLVLMGLLGENPQLANAKGSLQMESSLGVTNWQWNKLDLKSWIKSIELQTAEIKLSSHFKQPQVSIESGKVNRWDIKIDSPDLKISSRAEGNLQQRLILKNIFDFDAKYLEILSPHVQRAEGRFNAEAIINLAQNYLNLNINSNANSLTVSTDLIPFTLDNLQYSVNYSDGELEIQKFSFRPDNGAVRASGTALFNRANPEINIRWFMDSASIPIKTRSHLTLTGNGMLFGNKPPYILSGDILINKGSILNEISDFTSDASSTVDTKYLPKEYGGAAAGLMKFDLSARTENPVNVSNSMMDINLAGDLHLHNDIFRPTADGRVYVSGTNSKVFFKNSEYQITKGEFLFNSRKALSKPDFDIIAASSISNYKVIAKAYGNPDNFTFDLTSEPALTKQNILSLIAFGYTDDLSNSISADDKQNLTNVGVGSFIFDQFKVTDIVKKQFGLQLNMGTVFEQSNSSMLSNRSGDQGGSGTLARTRTATNIEVKKRLSEAVSLSVSSTVGGQIGQRQRMNLNYGLSKGVQLEGIYELRTNADGQEDVIDNSIGGDVKFRMTFR